MSFEPNQATSLVSIIIPVFNRAEMLREAVDSALRQSYEKIEIIIVDDGSSDDTYDVALRLAQDNEVISAYRQENKGPGAARQYGFEQSKGRYIQFLDSDDLIAPEKISLQVKELITAPHADVVYCRQNLVAQDGRITEEGWMRTKERHSSMFPAMLGGRIWGTPVPLYDRQVLLKAGPWTNLKNQEDWEFDCRVAIHSQGLSYVDEALVDVRRHNDSHLGSQDNKSTLKDHCAAMKLIAQHASTAKVEHSDENYDHFIRYCFFMSRKASKTGLHSEAIALLKVCLNHRTASRKHHFEYRAFSLLTKLVGSKNAARLASLLMRRGV